MISAKIIADSKNHFGNRLTTFIVTFPRYILAELNTHRMFSRNSASSRAIPFEKMMDSVLQNPFIPMAWQKDHKGMQGTEYITEQKEIQKRTQIWLQARTDVVTRAQDLYNLGTTKQMCNRPLEAFMYHTVIITASEYENFFALRCPKYYHYVGKTNTIRYRSRKDAINHWETIKDDLVDYHKVKDWTDVDWLKMNEGQADIHMMALAEAMWDAYNESIPSQLNAGEWHIPFFNIESNEFNDLVSVVDLSQTQGKTPEEVAVMIATARCARVSYTVFGEEKASNYENDIKLHDGLAKSGHWSPFEHCARVMDKSEYYLLDAHPFDKLDDTQRKLVGNLEGWSGNFKGFIQYRKMFNNENITT